MNFGLLIINTIHNKNQDEAKRRLLTSIKKIRDEKMKEQEDKFVKQNYYMSNYEKKRNDNDELYKGYYINFLKLKDNWIKSGKESDLELLKKLKRPELIDIEDIYTYMLIRNKNFKF